MPLRPGPGPADTRPGPKPAPLHAKLPAELLGYCLSFSTRWAAVSCTQLVCRHWRLLCRGPRVALEPLIIVTLSGRSSLVVLDRGGRPRCSLPCAPWRARCRVRVWGERAGAAVARRAAAPRRGAFRSGQRHSSATYEDWPTCTLASPKRLYVSQYRCSGVLSYAVCEDGRLKYHRTYASRLLEYPEGLATLPGAPGLLYVCTCNGTVASVDVDSGALLWTVNVGGGLVAWNMVADGRSLYVAAHAPGDAAWYEDATRGSTGRVLRCDVDAARPERVGAPRAYASGLNRPSGLAFVGDGARRRLLVTSYASASRGAPRPRGVAEFRDAGGGEAALVAWRLPADGATKPWGLAAAKDGAVLTCGRGPAPLVVQRAGGTPAALLPWGALAAAAGGDGAGAPDANVLILA